MQGNIKVRDLLVPRMQMKELADSIEMPRLVERDVKYELSQIERDIYETLLEEDGAYRFPKNPCVAEISP